MIRKIGVYGLCAVGFSTVTAGEIDFARDVRPILTANCTECHGGVKAAGGVSFIYKNEVVGAEGDSGNPVVKPGDLDASEMIYRITTEDTDDHMPPVEDHPEGLTEKEIAILKQWVKEGASWGEHWSFETPQLPELPEVTAKDWPKKDLDRFVLARLEAEKIVPAPDAPDYRWLRRTSLDLIGLPPTVEEIQNFDGNREAAVDRLLASPRFGERWATVWLDLMRYADSKGLGQDGKRAIWKYRDWVIDSFNRDLPYNEFTIKQIAGDLLPNATIEDLVATTCHRLTQTNEEGGTDDEQFRIEAVIDRVSTTWQTWQGITFGCVQCHSHPYDPIKHEEFYQFVDFFNNTKDIDLNEELPVLPVPIDSSNYEKARELDVTISQLQQAVWEQEFAALDKTDAWKPLTGIGITSNKPTKFVPEKVRAEEHFVVKGTITNGSAAIVKAPVPNDIKSLTAIRFTGMPKDLETAKSDAEWGFVISHFEASLIPPNEGAKPIPLKIARVISDEVAPFHDPNLSLNAKDKFGFGAYSKIHFPRSAAFILEKPAQVSPGSRIEVKLSHSVNLLASFALVTKRGSFALTDDSAFTKLLTDGKLTSSRRDLAALKKERDAIKSVNIPILAERPKRFERPTHVFSRGLYLTKDAQVTSAVPSSMPGKLGEQADRLALAEWLVSRENPLTARVAVNRFWAQLFGTGIVATEEDFGSAGETPSHQPLLDYLAVKFQTDYNWSQKRLLKEIVLSRTYGQSSTIRPELQERDSANRLLARGPRHRLPAETIRDQALFVSGLLSSKMHGEPVHPPIPDGVWKPFQASDKWQTPKNEDPNRYRRAIYTYTKRSIPYPMFAAFDAPSREFCNPRRLRSNTPIQALMTLNDITFSDASVAFGENLKALEGNDAHRIRTGFLTVTAREPSESEVARLSQLLATTSWNDVANVLLNLDETLTK